MGKLTGKIALITGAASGIGRATALLFGKEGAKVAVVDVDEPGAAQVAVQIVGEGGEAIAIRADVSRASDAQRMVADTIKHFGRLDIIYNNAGISPPGLIETITEAEWDRVIDINLKGVFLGCKYALPELMKHGGVVLSTASVAGLEGGSGLGHYCASKAGVVMLTKNIAIDYAPYGIRANCICPGGIETNIFKDIFPLMPEEEQQRLRNAGPGMQVLNRMGQPEEIARVALFLCSDDASFVTGHAMLADGGWMAGHRIASPWVKS